MKKLLIAALFCTAIIFKPSVASADPYDDGYIGGYMMAVQAVKIAIDNHPEWAIQFTAKDFRIGSTYVEGYSMSNSETQAAMLAVNYVNAQYLPAIYSYLPTTPPPYPPTYYTGMLAGFNAGTAACVLGLD